MINPITVLESVAMVFYIIAIYLCALRFKNSSTDFQIVFILMMIGLLMGALASLTDVIEYVKKGSFSAVSLLVAGMEEAFTPLFGFLWVMATYSIMHTRKRK